MFRIRVPERLPFFSYSLRAVMLLFFLASLAAPPVTTTTTARKVAEPLDLAAMVLIPEDLAAAGLDGFYVEASFQAHEPELIADWSALTPLDEATRDVDAFRAAAPARGNVSHLYDISKTEPEMSGYVVISFAFEYSSSRDARAGFNAMTDIWLESETMAEQQIPLVLAKDQMLVVGTGSNPWETEEIDRVSVAFRDGNVVGGIILLSFLNDDPPVGQRILPPAPEAIVELAKTQITRTEQVVQSGGPGLSTTILRLDVPIGDRWGDNYIAMDGLSICRQTFQLVGPDACEESQAKLDERGEVTRFRNRQLVRADNILGDPLGYYANVIITFKDETAAEAYMASYPDVLAEFEGNPADLIMHEVKLGDEAIGSTWTLPNDEWLLSQINVRVSNTVIRMEHQVRNDSRSVWAPEIPEDLTILMETQLA